jgi:hypothetical protein
MIGSQFRDSFANEHTNLSGVTWAYQSKDARRYARGVNGNLSIELCRGLVKNGERELIKNNARNILRQF